MMLIKKQNQFSWPLGFQSGAVNAGFKEKDPDMGWLVSKVSAKAAGVYTTNQFMGAPTYVTKNTIDVDHHLQAMLINSGNANSCTGKLGLENADQIKEWVGKKLEITSDLIGVASTGIIGKQLPMTMMKKGISNLTLSDDKKLPKAIITTDTKIKEITIQFELSDQLITMSGFAKGSGMIEPNMATTLGFITTDADIDAKLLQNLLSEEIKESFNQITVDNCMSTNDMVVAMANGMAANPIIKTTESKDYQIFKTAFNQILVFLAKSIASDGEGASKLVEAQVNGASNHLEANVAAKAIVGSNLVKAMIYGNDANWGRIIQALGQSNISLDIDQVSIKINGFLIVEHSQAIDFDPTAVIDSLANDQIEIEVDLGIGFATGMAWGCDLTYQYVEINSAYES